MEPEEIERNLQRSKQQERGERILDAAADLLIRWGYKRVTIDDIARQAGIGTGTIYLHWKTRDALFETLMLREGVAIWREMLELIRADPMEIVLSRMVRSELLIVMKRPLARAMFMGDSELLGKLEQGEVMQQLRQRAPTREFLLMMRNAGLLRSDMSLSLQLYAISASATGFFLIDSFLEDGEQLSLEEKAEALAQTVHFAFEPETFPPISVLLTEVVPKVTQAFEYVCEYCEQQMQHRTVFQR